MKRLFKYLYHNKNLAVGLAIICTAIILFACLLPSNKVVKVNVPMLDKWVHLLAFSGFSISWSFLWRSHGLLYFISMTFISAAFGYLIELLQISGITRGRSFEYLDILADTIGGICGCIIFIITKHYLYERRKIKIY